MDFIFVSYIKYKLNSLYFDIYIYVMKSFFIYLLIIILSSCSSLKDINNTEVSNEDDEILNELDDMETSSGYTDSTNYDGWVSSGTYSDEPTIVNDQSNIPNFNDISNDPTLPKKSKIVSGETKVLVKDYVDDLKLENNNGILVYSVQDEVKVGIFFTVRVRISKNKDKQKIVFGDRGISIYESDIKSTVSLEMIDIKPVMSSSLLGDSDKFKITSLSSEFQDIDSIGYTEWTWRVTPLKGGKNYLKLLVKYKSKNDNSYKDITIFDRKILVSPNIKYTITNWLSEYWQWLLTTLLIPLFKWILGRRKKKETI